MTVASVEADGEEIFVSYLRDISRRVAAQRELVEARDRAVAGEKAKDELLAVMSHEMRTPLNGILGTMELMHGTGLSAAQRRYLSAMETSADLLLHHVNDVLSISRAEAGQLDLVPTEIDPAEFLNELVDGQRSTIAARGNTVSVSTEHGPRRIWADRTRLHQVLLNLLGNANKFTNHGRITLECDSVPGGRMVELRVIDDGIGIAEEDQTRIWEDFRTLDASYGRVTEGSGLGLAISRRLVTAMDGKIGVESEPGQGSLFWVRQPVGAPTGAPSPQGRTGPRHSQRPHSARPLDVLLVEDNRINRLVARDMLEQAGHRVTEAHDGREGVHIAERKPFDVILMDISMPEIDGVAATRTIRGANGPNRRTPIVALTAHALDDDLARFRAAGVTDTLVKPLTGESLDRVLGRHRAARHADADGGHAGAIAALQAQIGAARAASLVETFVAETDELADALRDGAAGHDDRDALADRAHKCTGSAAALRCTTLGDSVRHLETALRTGDAVALPGGVAAFLAAWTVTRPDVLALLEDMRDD